jgi:invasion protein IalB
MGSMKALRALLPILLLILGAAPAFAQSTLSTFGDWTAFSRGSGKGKVCYLGASPDKAEGKYSKRGDVYALVTHRPGDKSLGVVSIESGYTYKKDSEVTLTIDGKERRLYTNGGQAWAFEKDDPLIVAAMKAGKAMIVKGMSSRGTKTTDTYRLKGFTAAFKAINKACGVKG